MVHFKTMALTDNPNAANWSEAKVAAEVGEGRPEPHPNPNRPGRGGDRGGRRPRFIEHKHLLQLGPEAKWLRRTAGQFRLNTFLRKLVAVAEALDLSWDALDKMTADPARYRAAIDAALDDGKE